MVDNASGRKRRDVRSSDSSLNLAQGRGFTLSKRPLDPLSQSWGSQAGSSPTFTPVGRPHHTLSRCWHPGPHSTRLLEIGVDLVPIISHHSIAQCGRRAKVIWRESSVPHGPVIEPVNIKPGSTIISPIQHP